MNKNIKYFVAGILTATAIFEAIVTVSGVSKVKTAQLHYNDIKLCVDGTYVQPSDASGNPVEPFIIDGTTYLPVRAVANAFGKEVDWDGNTKTVFLGKKPSAANEGTMQNPVKLNTTKNVPALNEDYSADFTVKEVIRGEKAIDMLAADDWEKEYHKERCENQNIEYFVIKLSVTPSSNYLSCYSPVYGGNPINDWSIKFADGYSLLESMEFFGETPDSLFEKLDFNNYSSGTVEGYIAFEVEKNEKMPILGIETDYQGNSGCWFKLEK